MYIQDLSMADLISSIITTILGNQPELAEVINSIITIRILGILTDMGSLINIVLTMIVGKQTPAETVSEFIKKNISVFSAIILCYSYCYLVSSRIPKGIFRIISLVPIPCILTILPFYLPPSFSSMIVASLITWPSIGRLCLFGLGMGPISSESHYSFIVSAALPIQKPSSRQPSSEPRTNLGTKFLIFAVLVGFISQYGEVLQPGTLKVAYGVFLYLYLEGAGVSGKSTFRGILGVELMTMFDEPYLSTSLQDFWGRRWNLVVSSTLRESVYKPVRSVSAVVLGSGLAPVFDWFNRFTRSSASREWVAAELAPVFDWFNRFTRSNPSRERMAAELVAPVFDWFNRFTPSSAFMERVAAELAPVPAYMATFMVSGLAHELLLLCLTRANPSWEMTAFFLLHGVCVVLEVAVKKALKGRVSMPWWSKFVTGPLTVGFVVLTSAWLFFPPVIRGGVDRMVCREFAYWRSMIGF